ncbi:MAG: DUF6371 domain-containing protein [Muribaculaceae bacterium]
MKNYHSDINYEKVFSIIDDITGLPFIKKGRYWYGKFYIDGSVSNRWDKTVVMYKAPNGIIVLENGGDSMTIINWLIKYGGVSDFVSAFNRLRELTSGVFTPPPPPKPEQEIKYISKKLTLSQKENTGIEKDNLFLSLLRHFKYKDIKECYHIYNTAPYRLKNGKLSTSFYYCNSSGYFLHDKQMLYKENGHRDHDFGGSRMFKINDGYIGKCYFGEHLFYKGAKVYLVESEKTALILSLYCKGKGKIFLATGGKNNLRDVEKDWKLLPDRDAFEDWNKKHEGQCVRWWECFPEYICGEKDDIGDYILWKLENKKNESKD